MLQKIKLMTRASSMRHFGALAIMNASLMISIALSRIMARGRPQAIIFFCVCLVINIASGEIMPNTGNEAEREWRAKSWSYWFMAHLLLLLALLVKEWDYEAVYSLLCNSRSEQLYLVVTFVVSIMSFLVAELVKRHRKR